MTGSQSRWAQIRAQIRAQSPAHWAQPRFYRLPFNGINNSDQLYQNVNAEVLKTFEAKLNVLVTPRHKLEQILFRVIQLLRGVTSSMLVSINIACYRHFFHLLIRYLENP